MTKKDIEIILDNWYLRACKLLEASKKSNYDNNKQRKAFALSMIMFYRVNHVYMTINNIKNQNHNYKNGGVVSDNPPESIFYEGEKIITDGIIKRHILFM